MDRRSFLNTSSLSAMAAQGAAAQTPVRETMKYVNPRTASYAFRQREGAKRPHIFFICLDMVSPDHFLPTRPLQREMEMPTIKALMADGVNFTNAFCTVPICSPSRASLYTGRYPYVMGNPGGAPDGQEVELRAHDVIYPEYLKAAGYRTKHVGKNHTGAQKFMDAFDELDSNYARAMPVMREDELYISYLTRMGVKLPRYSRQVHRMDLDRKKTLSSLGGWIEQNDGKPFPLEGQYSWYLSQWAIDRTKEALAPGRNAPLYLQLNIYDPHNPFTIPDGFQKREAELRKAITLPPSYQNMVARDFKPEAGEPAVLDFHRRLWGMYDPAKAKDYMVANALAMEVIDKALAKFIQSLKDLKIYDESWIMFTADHGEMNMHHALVDKGAYLHPETQRVPLVVKPPVSLGAKKGTVVEAPVSLLDIAPTVCDAAGLTPVDRLDGVSLVPYIRDPESQGDRSLIFQNGWLSTGNPACGTQRWERGGRHHFYLYNLGSVSDEVYDLNDPDARNIASESSAKDLRREMSQRMFDALGTEQRWGRYRIAHRFAHYADLHNA